MRVEAQIAKDMSEALDLRQIGVLQAILRKLYNHTKSVRNDDQDEIEREAMEAISIVYKAVYFLASEIKKQEY